MISSEPSVCMVAWHVLGTEIVTLAIPYHSHVAQPSIGGGTTGSLPTGQCKQTGTAILEQPMLTHFPTDLFRVSAWLCMMVWTEWLAALLCGGQ